MIEYIVAGLTSFSLGGAACWIFRTKLERVSILFRNRYTHPIEGVPKLVLVARTDVEMSAGKLASQCAHAAVICYKAASKYDSNIVELWECTGQPKIVVKCNTESELKKLSKEAQNAKTVTALVKDAGRTQVPSGTVTVLGIGPAPKNVIDRITGHLRVY